MRSTLAALILLALAAPASAQDKKVIGQGPINPANPPRISPAIRTGNLLFVSGQLGRVPMDSGGPGTTGEQTTRVMQNIKRFAEEGGSSMDMAVKCLVFLADIADFQQMNAAYSPFFPKDPPARSTVAVAALVNQAKVEIECIFAIPAGK